MKGSRTTMNRYKPRGYRTLKKTKKKEDNGHMMAAASHHVPRPSSTWNHALKPA